MDKLKIGHYIVTGILAALMIKSGGGYLIAQDQVAASFADLGFPAYVIIPMGLAKIAGAIVIVWKPIGWLSEWAYAGFNFNFFLAAWAHISVGDGQFGGALGMLTLLYISYTTWKYLEKRKIAQ